MKTKVYIPIPVSSGELPELNQQVYTIDINENIRKSKCVTYKENTLGHDLGMTDKWFEYIERDTCFQHHNVEFWLKETIIDIPEPDPNDKVVGEDKK